jgi:uncharacterized protein (TIGR00661 family)
MRLLFIVQGQGRGHMTQAIALRQILARQGHQLCGVLVGRSQSRLLPKFFIEQIQAPVSTFCSPNFQLDTQRRGISIVGTLFFNLKHLPVFIRSLHRIYNAVRQYKPDVIVNFYDPLAAIYAAFRRPKIKMVCIAHQYLMMHPGFVFPRNKRIARWAMLVFTRVCTWGAETCLALSFRSMPDIPKYNLRVVPPLLRAEIRNMKPSTENFILSYVLNDGYAKDIANEHRHFPDLRIKGFWDRQNCSGIAQLNANLEFQPLDGIAFLDAMRRCSGLICTAGFESICEAMYFGKPVFMIPVAHQIEQYCNAVDACREGIGLWDSKVNLAGFLDYLPRHRGSPKRYFSWVHSAQIIYPEVFKHLVYDN